MITLPRTKHSQSHKVIRTQTSFLFLNVYLNYYVHMQNHAAPPPQDARAHCPANALFSDFNPAPNTCVSVCVCLCVCVSVCVYVCVCVSS